MDIKSYTQWDDYSRARNAMLEATDTAVGAVVRGEVGRQEARAPERDRAPAQPGALQEAASDGAEPLPKHRKVSKGLEPKVPLKFVPEIY